MDLMRATRIRQPTLSTSSITGTEIAEAHSIPLPSKGGTTTPPIIEAATTYAPARWASGESSCSHARPVGTMANLPSVSASQ